MPSNHVIFCRPLLLLPSIFPSIRVFSNESVLHLRWPKYWSFSFNISPSNEYSGLISFRMDWLDLLAVQVILESSPTPQFKSINFSALSILYSPTLTSIHDYHSLASGQTTGREHSPTHQQKIGLKICWAWPCSIRTRPSFPLSQSLPSESFHKPLILIHQRADRMKATITENWSNWSHASQPSLTQWNYEPCSVGPLKTTGHSGEFWQNVVHWRREWPTTSVFLPWEPHEQYEKAKNGILKDELPRMVGAQYATGDHWRNNSRKNTETEPKQKQHPIVDVTGDESKVRCCKEQYYTGT